MAILQNLILSGSLNLLPATEYTGSYGYIWYDRDVQRLRYSVQGILTTSRIGGIPTTIRCYIGGAGTQTAGLIFGGSSPSYLDCTEEYNGSVWSSGGALNQPRSTPGGAGTQDAGLAFGGFIPTGRVTCTEEYNGTAWTSTGALTLARNSLGDAGTQNAAVGFGGSSAPVGIAPYYSDCTEEYDGATWSSGGTLNQCRRNLAGAGTQNAALGFGGLMTSATVGCTEEYDGTSWASVASMNLSSCCPSGAGLQDSAFAFSNLAAAGRIVEHYDGTTWTFDTPLLLPIQEGTAAGSSTAGYLAVGVTSALTASPVIYSEEYDVSSTIIIKDFREIPEPY